MTGESSPRTPDARLHQLAERISVGARRRIMRLLRPAAITAFNVAALKARGYLAERGARAVPGDLGRILAKAGMSTPIPSDELSEGWPEKPAEAAPGPA